MISQPHTESDGEDEHAREYVEEIYHTNIPVYSAKANTQAQKMKLVRILVYTRKTGRDPGQAYILFSCDCDAFANNQKEQTNGFFLT